jgi:hypothetical protein
VELLPRLLQRFQLFGSACTHRDLFAPDEDHLSSRQAVFERDALARLQQIGELRFVRVCTRTIIIGATGRSIMLKGIDTFLA